MTFKICIFVYHNTSRESTGILKSRSLAIAFLSDIDTARFPDLNQKEFFLRRIFKIKSIHLLPTIHLFAHEDNINMMTNIRQI